MKSFETIIHVKDDGTTTARLPRGMVYGSHRAVIVIDDPVHGRLPASATLSGYAPGTFTVIGDIVAPLDEAWDAAK
jgi:hypothetical protein